MGKIVRIRAAYPPPSFAHQQKIHAAKHQFEESDGRTIKADKVVEWALLEIAEMLHAIHYQVTMMNVPKITRESGYRAPGS